MERMSRSGLLLTYLLTYLLNEISAPTIRKTIYPNLVKIQFEEIMYYWAPKRLGLELLSSNVHVTIFLAFKPEFNVIVKLPILT